MEDEFYRRACDWLAGAALACAFAGLVTGHLLGAAIAGGALVSALLLRGGAER